MGKQFKKYLENYARGQLSELVGHSEEIWKALEQSEFITPRVLGSSDGMICYEYLDIRCRIDEVWKKDLDIEPSFQ